VFHVISYLIDLFQHAQAASGVYIFMSVKLLILGLPGSGKSTIARYVIDYIERQKSDCYIARVNDYDILYAMYKADIEGKFSPTGRDGFDVLDPSVCDSALKTMEQEVIRAEQTVNNHAQATFKPMLILIEFARDDYRWAFQQFAPHFLLGAYILFLDARIEICKARIRARVAHPRTPDDHEVSEYIFNTYYDKKSAHVLPANIMADYHIQEQCVKVLDNNGSIDEIRGEIDSFIDAIVKHLPGKIH
jgi:thymidylate kinase